MEWGRCGGGGGTEGKSDQIDVVGGKCDLRY